MCACNTILYSCEYSIGAWEIVGKCKRVYLRCIMYNLLVYIYSKYICIHLLLVVYNM